MILRVLGRPLCLAPKAGKRLDSSALFTPRQHADILASSEEVRQDEASSPSAEVSHHRGWSSRLVPRSFGNRRHGVRRWNRTCRVSRSAHSDRLDCHPGRALFQERWDAPRHDAAGHQDHQSKVRVVATIRLPPNAGRGTLRHECTHFQFRCCTRWDNRGINWDGIEDSPLEAALALLILRPEVHL